MPESSDSDHIGRVGEIYFDLLANKAKLLVGQIQPDRLGRDRVLEFERSSIGSQSYDMRPPPLGCSVQIKTIYSTNDRVAISLSVADRLAGDTRPTFILIIRIDRDDEIVDMYLVHLWDQNLGRILKRLRKEYAKGHQNLNKKKISFAISSGSRVELKPKAMKNAFRDMIALDMESYSQRKIEQRKTLGFDKSSFLTGRFSFEAASADDLIDGMLGLKKLKITDFKLFEERFNISLPFEFPNQPNFQNSHWELIPQPVDTAILCFRNPESEEVAELDCELFAPALPGIPLEKIKYLARTIFFDATIGFDKFTMSYSELLPEDTKLPIDKWINYFRSIQIVSSGGFELELKSNEGNSLLLGSATLPMGNDKVFTAELDIYGKLKEIRTEARASDTAIAAQSIFDSSHEIRLVHAYFFEPSSVGTFSFSSTFVGEQFLLESKVTVLLVTALIVGSERYAYGLQFEMDVTTANNEYSFVSTSMRPLQILRLADSVDSLTDFGHQLGRISGVSLKIIQELVPQADLAALT